MAQRFQTPFEAFINSTPSVYAGGFLYFYESGTSTPLDTYNDPDLAAPHANSNPILLNSAGRPSVAIYLKNQLYTVVLKDSSLNTIWTADNVATTDFASVIVTKVGSGSPSGVVAGTAGSSSVLPTMYWDYTNSFLYVCTTTGVAAVAVWTALNAAAATPTVVAPQGYLTPTSATPIIASDVTSATAIYYTPTVGNLVPIYNGSRFVPTEFAELTLTLASQHALNTIYDVFVFSNSSVLTLATGPAWNNSAAAAGSRGTGASTTQLTRLAGGYYVNAVQITGRNGSTTYTIGANLATYLGSIFIDGTAGQVTCHLSHGQSRKWAVWNAYNRRPLLLQAGDSTASWAYSTFTIRASRADAANSVTLFCGLAEEPVRVHFGQSVAHTGNNPTSNTVYVTIGWNSTTTNFGRIGSMDNYNGGAINIITQQTLTAEYIAAPFLGINVATCLEAGNIDTTTFSGTESFMKMTAEWRG